MTRYHLTLASVLFFSAGLVGLFMGWQTENMVLNNGAMGCTMIAWVLARWLDEREKPHHARKSTTEVLLVLIVPAVTSLFVGVVLLQPAPEPIRIVAAMSGVIAWGLLKLILEVRKALW